MTWPENFTWTFDGNGVAVFYKDEKIAWAYKFPDTDSDAEFLAYDLLNTVLKVSDWSVYDEFSNGRR